MTYVLQLLYENAVHFAEVKFLFIITLGGVSRTLALISLYSPPDEHLLALSHTTLVVCRYQGEQVLVVIDVKLILSVVAMIPFPFIVGGHGDQHFMVEKIGLDVIEAVDYEDIE